MIITCPQCNVIYRIDPSGTTKHSVRIKCPGCAHLFNVSLAESELECQSPVSGGSEDGRPGVLVVDDARFFREMIAEILKDLPVVTRTAKDCNDAWRQLQENPPRLLILDLNIPGKSGYELLKDIQQAPNLAQMKILVMSGVQRGEQVAAEVGRLGAAFSNKSFTPGDLQDRVRKILEL